jgi:germination protein M
MKLRLCLALTAFLMLSACSSTANQEEIQIYYAVSNGGSSLSALDSESWQGSEADVEHIFRALCQSPESSQLYSLIPQNTTLQSWKLKNGKLSLDLSGEYATLSGVQLTIANYCIALSMTQLDQVEAVSITADGEPMTQQEWLTEDQVMLSGGQGDTGQITAYLYFPMEDGEGIGVEERALELAEDDTPPEAILTALCQGPESKLLIAYLPDSAEDITLWVDNEICYVNLTEEWTQELEESQVGLSTVLRCITNSLCGQESVSSVQFLMDGAVMEDWEDTGWDFPVFPDESGIVDVEGQ